MKSTTQGDGGSPGQTNRVVLHFHNHLKTQKVSSTGWKLGASSTVSKANSLHLKQQIMLLLLLIS
ncbi:hypothetical protein, partial [Leisingera caerulea]|uniref:hypothetical protein n=1 Tax=Leisingera caerulea TaxID=506591 RepID=UPI001AE0E49A